MCWKSLYHFVLIENLQRHPWGSCHDPSCSRQLHGTPAKHQPLVELLQRPQATGPKVPFYSLLCHKGKNVPVFLSMGTTRRDAVNLGVNLSLLFPFAKVMLLPTDTSLWLTTLSIVLLLQLQLLPCALSASHSNSQWLPVQRALLLFPRSIKGDQLSCCTAKGTCRHTKALSATAHSQLF